MFLSISRHEKLLLNLLLRGGTLAARFLLVFFLARYLSAESYGVYGVIVASISYGVYFIGLDFYTYSTREMIVSPKSEWGRMIYSQFLLGGMIVITFIPVFCFLYFGDIFPKKYFFIFFAILILEWLNQEITRILTSAQDVIRASIILFIRSALWVFLLILFFIIFENHREIDCVFYFWLFFDFLALFLGFYFFKKNDIRFLKAYFDYRWVVKGLKVSFIFLLGTLCLRGISTFDKYYISEFFDYEAVGVYVFYAGISGVILAFLDALVFSFLYPKLIVCVESGKYYDFEDILKKMGVAVFFISAGYAVFLYFFIDVILGFINKISYQENLNILWYCLLFNVLWAFSMIFHYAVYALKLDKVILFAHAVGIMVFVVFLWVFRDYKILWVVPVAVSIAFFAIFGIKAISYFLAKKNFEKEMSNA